MEENDGLVPDLRVSQWLLIHLLLSIPIVGLVMRIIWSIGRTSSDNAVLINFGKASLIWWILSFCFQVACIWFFIMVMYAF